MNNGDDKNVRQERLVIQKAVIPAKAEIHSAPKARFVIGGMTPENLIAEE